MSTIEPGRYRHYKGNTYKVIGVGRHSETGEQLVIYQAEHMSMKFGKNAIWARPLRTFFETVEYNGRKVPRFTRINNTKSS